MTTRQIEKNDWQSYFDRVSRELSTTTIDVEVSGTDMGVQEETHEAALVGLSYDPRDDAFSIVAEALEHRVTRPEQIFVEEEASELHSVEIVDGDGHRHIAKLHQALRLPSK